MRTTGTIRKEAAKALIKYKDHFNNCTRCQEPLTDPINEIICSYANSLFEDYQNLLIEANHADKLFKAELKERVENNNNNKS